MNVIPLAAVAASVLAASGFAYQEREDIFGNHPPPGTPHVLFRTEPDLARLVVTAQTGNDPWSAIQVNATREVAYRLNAADGPVHLLAPGSATAIASDEPWRAGDLLAFCAASPGPVALTVWHGPTAAQLGSASFDSLPVC